ncbi:unnamed protein product, partial [Ectocarpus sp. 8 AP-2014]
MIRYAILQLPKKKTTATCPSYCALRKQAERDNAIFRYWQNGLRETMPSTEFAGKGWSVDPRGNGNDGVELTVKNCVLDLSEFSYIRAVAIRRRPCATGAGARTGSARSLAAAEVVAPNVGRRRHPCEQ